MGIPGIFRELTKKHKSILKKINDVKRERPIDFLFFDFNCLMYHVLKQVSKTHEHLLRKKQTTKFENVFIEEIIKYLDEIICEEVQPSKLVYIAVDGVPPRAKMLQQRTRRFSKIKEKRELTLPLKEKHGEPIIPSWDTNQLSPGTKFMAKMSKKIQKAIKDDRFCKHNKIRVIFNDSSIPGEGEAKIYPYIRNIRCNDECRFVVYGMDGDLVILSMLSNKKNVYLIREPAQARVYLSNEYRDEKLIMVDIFELLKKFKEDLGIEGVKDFRSDYALLSFFGGNDFIKTLPHTRVRENAGRKNGLEYLIDCYKRIRGNFNDPLVLVSDYDKPEPIINIPFLKALFAELGKSESRRLQLLDMTRKNSTPRREKPEDADKSEYEKEYILRFHTPYYKMNHPEREKYIELLDKIDYRKSREEWKDAYYEHFFDIKPSEDRTRFLKFNQDVSNEYFKSIVWCLRYYFDGVPPSWDYFYPFRVAPFASDLQRALNKLGNINKKYKFKLGVPMRPLQQLLFILPPQNKLFLPVALRPLMTSPKSPILDMYPIDFELDVVDGLKREYSEALLPEPDFERLIMAYNKINKVAKLDVLKSNKLNDKPLYFNMPTPKKKKVKAKKSNSKPKKLKLKIKRVNKKVNT